MTGKHNQPHKAHRLARIGFALATAAMLVAPASSAVAESRLAPAKAPESIAPAPAAVISTAAATTPVAAIPQALEQEAQEFEAIKGGTASFYGRELRGNRTASGERFNPDDLTAAHPSLPFGTMLRVTNPRNGDSVMVRVNDRGPFHSNRVIDLSEAAAKEIGIARMGSGKVELAVLNDGTSDE